MKFKIRTKLISAFFAMLVPFSLVFLTNYFLTQAVQENTHISRDISYELENLGDLQLALDRLLMPANDYIITGDTKERVEFNRLAGEVEKHLALIPMEKRCQQCHQARTTEMVARLYGREASKDMSEEMLILKEIRDRFEEVKKYGEAIFNIKMPEGSAEAARLMKEMDALARKAMGGPIGRHMQMEEEDMRKAHEATDKAWRRFQIGMTIGYLAALIIGAAIVLIYSGRLASVIKLLHKGSDSIAKGDFKARVDIKTGDEFEQLAAGINEMAAQLDSLYLSLEQKVEERTRELKESNERFDLAVKGTNDGIWDWNIGTNTNYFSPRFMELLDYGPGELSYELATFEFLLHPEDRARVFDRVRQHLEDKVPYNVEYRLRTKNGEYRWFLARGEALRDQSGKPFRMAGSITGITERKAAEEKIKEQLDYLERFQKVALKREFRIKELTTEIEKLKAGNAELEEKLRKA